MRHLKKTLLALTFMSLFPLSAHAYIGPGVGAGAILLTVVVGLAAFFLLFGLVWYPLKRLLGKVKPSKSQ